jgi:hypothetical protein
VSPHSAGREPTPIYETSIPNPLHGAFPQWTAKPLPAQVQVGSLQVTLSEFVSGLGTGGIGVAPTVLQRSRVWTRIRMEVRSHGRPAPWAPASAETFDATGNYWNSYGCESGVSDGGGWLALPFDLSPVENAYRLRIKLVQTAGAAVDDRWTTPPLSPDARPGPAPDLLRFQLHGKPLSVLSCSRVRDGSGRFAWSVQVQAPPPDSDREVGIRVLRAVDERGRAFAAPWGPTAWSASDVVAFHLRPPANARSIRLTFGTPGVRYVEFVAVPRRAGGGGGRFGTLVPATVRTRTGAPLSCVLGGDHSSASLAPLTSRHQTEL